VSRERSKSTPFPTGAFKPNGMGSPLSRGWSNADDSPSVLTYIIAALSTFLAGFLRQAFRPLMTGDPLTKQDCVQKRCTVTSSLTPPTMCEICQTEPAKSASQSSLQVLAHIAVPANGSSMHCELRRGRYSVSQVILVS
jgi:hypothetical protein